MGYNSYTRRKLFKAIAGVELTSRLWCGYDTLARGFNKLSKRSNLYLKVTKAKTIFAKGRY